MKLYLITQSAWYYPGEGENDYRSIHTDEAEAREAFEARGSIGMQSTVYLIELSAEGWRTLAERDVR
jgi:hypothetical protein